MLHHIFMKIGVQIYTSSVLILGKILVEDKYTVYVNIYTNYMLVNDFQKKKWSQSW